jgi:Ni/Fe-hydrogenase 1 B-type cytochrome subunit
MSTATATPTAEAPHPIERGFSRVYIWHWPVRIFHWAMAASILVLIATGLYISRPYFALAPGGTTPFLMGWMRFIHFLAAIVLDVALILRVYALFIGNRYETWGSLVPWGKRDWVNFRRMARKYVVSDWWSPPHYVGHNPVLQLVYTLVHILLLFMVATGFALYGQANPGGFWWTVATSWVMPLFGGNQMVRLLHHLGMWVIVAYVIVHIYLVIRADVLYDRGSVSSMISGYKHKQDKLEYEDG